ncbi:MAG: bifunctional 4-hydroxy-3-methylbut-2-enyl diphosphate reductase/30S ribosomal protein S1 [Clostridiales bacterium]|nr:bifunctional 4-hydroxy-3-methylbut-2-enyl diphosphate reductase/30S ribosomal protein S1 [Clostridiales bacterium]
MKIYIAKESGFCFGVDKAIEMAYEAKNNSEMPLYTFGPLIHNKQVIEKLASSDIYSVNDLDELNSYQTVLIRSHGVGEDIYKKMKILNLKVIDATCPYVKKVHTIVKKNCKDGHLIVIIGDANHPEIIGVKGWCKNHSIVVNHPDDVEKISFDGKIIVVAQTTLKIDTFNTILDKINSIFKDVLVYNTICSATSDRQNAANELSKKVEYMIIIGGKHSSNTKKLYEISKQNCSNSIHIETKDDLIMKDIKKYGKIGITAGASTPDWIIKEVVDKLINEGEGILMHDNSEMSELMEQFDESYNVPRNGKIIKGKIVMIGKDELIVNIGYKADGIIPREEISAVNAFDLNKSFAVDQEIEAVVIQKDNGEGNVLLSMKRMAAKQNWEDLENAFNEKKIITVKVDKAVKGGLTATFEQIRGFIPASHVDAKFVENLNSYEGKEFDVEIIEFNRKKNKIVFSRKNLVKKQYEEKMNEAWSKLEEGKIVTGIVRRFTDFGAFIDVYGIDGLLHVSEISWGKVNKPKDILKKNQEVEVKILELNRKENKISLSIKQLTPNPWEVVEEKYIIDEEYEGIVTSLTAFGAFVELEPGLEGLVHVSQISNDRIEKPSDVLKVGESVKVKVIEINKEESRIKLSMK